MEKQTLAQRIKELNKELDPFYLVDLDNGKFSLCVQINHMDFEFGQPAFDAYAHEVGTPPRDHAGYVTYGSGYDWEAAFREAFKDDPNLKRIRFDCESSGFFCDGNDLDMMAEFGRQFRALCLDTARFTPIVSAGMKNARIRRYEEHRMENSVRGYIMRHPAAKFHIRTNESDFMLAPGDGAGLLDGTIPSVSSLNGDAVLLAEDFLEYQVTGYQEDLLDKDFLKLIAEPEMEEVFDDSQHM